MANGPAIIASTFPVKERGTALGTLAMAVSLGLISGPSIGGFLLVDWGWKSIFLINIPIGLIGMFLIMKHAPDDPKERKKIDFDWWGAILQSLVLVPSLWLIDPSNESQTIQQLPDAIRWLLAASIAIVMGYLFVRVERRVSSPILDLSLLEIKTFRTANLSGFLFFVAYSTIAVLMPFFLEEARFFPPDTSGVLLSAIPIAILISAPISGRLSDLFGSRGLCILGALLIGLSLLWMSGMIGVGLHGGTAKSSIVTLMAIVGLGMGIFQSPNNNVIICAVPEEKLGVASALIATVRNLGMVIGAGISTGIFYWQKRMTGDFVSALKTTFFIGAIFSALCMLSSLGKPKGRLWTE